MTLLAAEQISKHFNDQVIVDGVSFTINDTDRVALVGKNGIGKTTLLEMLAGKQELDSGVITRARSCVIDYVEQEKSEYLDMNLFDFVAHSRADLIEMRARIRDLEHYLEDNPGDTVQLEKLGELQHEFEQKGGFHFENEVSLILSGLGFGKDRYQDRLRNFSGGERNRAGLARILAGAGNLLLLDEPTNHLDIESTAWLEEYLAKLEKACVIVSHDRAFLTAVADKVWEIVGGQIELYHGGFEVYLRERTARRERAAHYYRHQQEEIKRIEAFVQKNMAGQKTKQAQSKLKYLNRIKRLPPPKSDDRGPSISVQSSGRSFAHVLSVDDVALGYGSAPIMEEISFDMYRGDRVGLIGRNGSGKSTLLKALIGELAPIDGDIQLGNKVNVAYFDQELSDLNEEATVLDNIWTVDPSAEAGKMRSFLGRFGFSGEDVFKKVSALSGGEKTKLCLAILLYHPANLIILDEPTNHLDIYAREALEEALREYDGSYLIVSHDRYFLDQVVDRIVWLNQGRVRVVDGNYSYFRDKMLGEQPAVPRKSEKQKQDYLEFKEQSKKRARLKKDIAGTREHIEKLEAELNELIGKLDDPALGDDWQKLQDLTRRREELEDQILRLYEKLEELEAIELD
ncbi:ATP-binding cassette domain-containing protein [candidate division GN15 bacterium]|nr:ATP-binding cassette domain-containing protein [candidate division GN15 bacterium]